MFKRKIADHYVISNQVTASTGEMTISKLKMKLLVFRNVNAGKTTKKGKLYKM